MAETLNPASSRECTADLPGDGEGVRGNQRRRDHAHRSRGGLEHLGNPQECPGGTGLRTAVGRRGAKDVQRWDGAQSNAWPGNPRATLGANMNLAKRLKRLEERVQRNDWQVIRGMVARRGHGLGLVRCLRSPARVLRRAPPTAACSGVCTAWPPRQVDRPVRGTTSSRRERAERLEGGRALARLLAVAPAGGKGRPIDWRTGAAKRART